MVYISTGVVLRPDECFLRVMVIISTGVVLRPGSAFDGTGYN